MMLELLHDRLYSQPWAIVPSRHKALADAINDKLTDNGSFPTLPPSTFAQQYSDTYVIKIRGSIVKDFGLPKEVLAFFDMYDLDTLMDEIMSVAQNPSIAQVVLDISSCGGTSAGLPEASKMIQALKQTRTVYAYTAGDCYSAAYWLASQCEKVFCSPSSGLGSVGTRWPRLDISQANAMAGIKLFPFVSSPKKSWGDPNVPITQEESDYRDAEVARITTEFQNAILSNRNINPKYLDASTFNGIEAVSKNFADGNFDTLDGLLQKI